MKVASLLDLLVSLIAHDVMRPYIDLPAAQTDQRPSGSFRVPRRRPLCMSRDLGRGQDTQSITLPSPAATPTLSIARLAWSLQGPFCGCVGCGSVFRRQPIWACDVTKMYKRCDYLVCICHATCQDTSINSCKMGILGCFRPQIHNSQEIQRSHRDHSWSHFRTQLGNWTSPRV